MAAPQAKLVDRTAQQQQATNLTILQRKDEVEFEIRISWNPFSFWHAAVLTQGPLGLTRFYLDMTGNIGDPDYSNLCGHLPI
jgi:hypothetical protein